MYIYSVEMPLSIQDERLLISSTIQSSLALGLDDLTTLSLLFTMGPDLVTSLARSRALSTIVRALI